MFLLITEQELNANKVPSVLMNIVAVARELF
jgi:hypothetical protein